MVDCGMFQGRRKEAEHCYRVAMDITPDSAEPYNALGTVKASEGKRSDAEKFCMTLRVTR